MVEVEKPERTSRARGHKHWPKDHPFYERAPVCRLTRVECDQRWMWHQHGHTGRPCEKKLLPGYVAPVCVLMKRSKPKR